MSVNHGKTVWKLTGTEENKAKAIELWTMLVEKPHHRWIPLAQIKETGHATITERQSNWLIFQAKRYRIDIGFQRVSDLQYAQIVGKKSE